MLTGKARIWMRVTNEMLIRRQLSTLEKLVQEYKLSVTMMLVTSNQNQVEKFTRVLHRTYDMTKKKVEPVQLICAFMVKKKPSPDWLKDHPLPE